MSPIADRPRFERTIALFDAANSADPNRDTAEGREWPKELLYAHRMTEMLARFDPEASEAVQIACRAQHIERWKIPRRDYPMTTEGYRGWRTALYKFHAERAGELMKQAGYDDDMVARVQRIVAKRGLKTDSETQTMEDVVDLVFIEHYMLAFAGQKADYTEEKWLGIIRKTWQKMSEAGRAFALSGKIRLPAPLLPLIQKAIRQA